ncbi:MAG: rod shape-determining protein [Firmicutes bacterium]|nr:rod shape-determining protein [Bacillota bacterium]
MRKGYFFMFGTDIGIDLGTANIIVFVKGKGIILQEPSVVAMDLTKKRICAIGEEAQRMIGRTPGNIQAIRPLSEGVIANYELTESIIKYFIHKAVGRRQLFKPRVVVCVPSGVTEVEKRAVLEATLRAGAKEVYLVSEPMAAAIGCGLDISQPSANMIVDIGGGTTDIAVISLKGEVVSHSLRIGGSHFEEAIIRHVKRTHNLAIGERTAEEIKIKIGTAYPTENRYLEVRGRDQVSGLPANVMLSSHDLHVSLAEPITNIIDAIKSVLEITPPELAADIVDKGIILTGGGALLDGLAYLINQETYVPVHVADNPITCVARGCGKLLEMLDGMQSVLVSSRAYA